MRCPSAVSISSEQARDVYEAHREDIICNLTLPPARELRDYHKELWIRFGKEETATVRRIEGVQERLKQQQEALNDLEKHQIFGAPTQPTKIEKIKYLTREIQTALRKANAWNSGQLEGLERSQNNLEEELEIIEKSLAKTKIDEVQPETVEDESASVKTSSNDTETSNNESVVTDENLFEDFHSWISRNGGHNGGWTGDDHLHMVTMTHRHANWRKMTERFMEDVWSGVRAVSSREAVRRHVEWYVEYCARRDKQKERIGQWRKRKAAVKEEERKQSDCQMKPRKLTRSSAWMRQNEEKLRKLEEWRKLKVVKKEIEEAEELLRVAEKKAKMEQRMERRNQQIKKFLKVREEKKRQQQEKEEEEKRMKEMERKHKREMNRMVLSQYHEKDMERIHWKIKMKAEEQARMIEERRIRQERMNRPSQARRDVDNIFKRTISSSYRERETKEKINLNLPKDMKGGKVGTGKKGSKSFQRRRSLDFGDLYHLQNLPKLAIPEWRTLV